MADVKITLADGSQQTYSGVETLSVDSATEEGATEVFVSKRLIQNQVQADMAQTDPSEVDYVKNKIAGHKDRVLAEIDVTAAVASNDNGDFGVVEGAALTTALVVGESYRVTIDGTEYICTAKSVDGSAAALGNLALILGGALGTEDTGEAFCVVPLSGNQLKADLWFEGSATQYRVAIALEDDVIRLGAEYLPKGIATEDFVREQIAGIEVPGGGSAGGSGSVAWDDIANKPFGESSREAVFFDGEFTLTYDSAGSRWNYPVVAGSSADHLAVGETYTVTVDGAVYELVAFDLAGVPVVGNPAAAGGEDNGVPFVLGEDITGDWLGEPGYVFQPVLDPDPTVATEVKYTVTITGTVTVIEKIDPKYLYQPDWDEPDSSSGGHILNRPFGRFAQDGAVAIDREAIFDDWLLMYDPDTWATYLDRSLIREGLRYKVVCGELEFDGVGVSGEDTASAVNAVSAAVGIRLTDGNSEYAGMVMVQMNGVLDIILLEQAYGEQFVTGSTYPVKITVADGRKPLGVEWLPEGIVLPAVTSADNGKVLMVVDGKWAAVELPAAEA